MFSVMPDPYVQKYGIRISGGRFGEPALIKDSEHFFVDIKV